MNNLWIFVLGPYLGATLAYYFFEFVYLPFLLKLKHLEII